MATDSTKVQIGPGIVSVGAYAASGGAPVGGLTDMGHYKTPIEVSISFENVDLESERSIGPIATKPVGQTINVTVASLEVIGARLVWMLRQADANYSAGTLRIGDGISRYHQVQILQNEDVEDAFTSLTVTLWRCQVVEVKPLAWAKKEWTEVGITFRALRDDSVSTADKYGKFVWA